MKPQWKHDCDKCKFLGQTIGGGKLVDLYAHTGYKHYGWVTLIARYGSDGPEYYSTDVGQASPNGHAELFVAQHLWEESQNVPEAING